MSVETGTTEVYYD